MALRSAQLPQPLGDTAVTIWTFLFGSVFRFLILLGFLFLALGAFWATGIEAGHLAIYGITAITIGVLGRLFHWWQIQDEY